MRKAPRGDPPGGFSTCPGLPAVYGIPVRYGPTKPMLIQYALMPPAVA